MPLSLSEHQPPRQIAGRPKVYAYERSLGASPEEACLRAGGKVDAGDAVKWEQNTRVQAWIAYFRSLGFSAETLAAAEASGYAVFDLARLINSALRSGPEPSEEEAVSNATWEIPRWPMFYSSWTFRSTASFLTSAWPQPFAETIDA
jgi:hypothetical protein